MVAVATIGSWFGLQDGQQGESNRKAVAKYAKKERVPLSKDNIVAAAHGGAGKDGVKVAMRRMGLAMGTYCRFSFDALKKSGVVLELAQAASVEGIKMEACMTRARPHLTLTDVLWNRLRHANVQPRSTAARQWQPLRRTTPRSRPGIDTGRCCPRCPAPQRLQRGCAYHFVSKERGHFTVTVVYDDDVVLDEFSMTMDQLLFRQQSLEASAPPVSWSCHPGLVCRIRGRAHK